MIAAVIGWSIRHRRAVLLACLALLAGGLLSLRQLSLDALPDLSDVQVIVKTELPGLAPQLVEDQLTYPLAAALLAVPGTKAVRGFSMFGESYVYVIFKDGTDLYWARSRILETLAQAGKQLPPGAVPMLGPDASGVGWVFAYALVDRSGRTAPDRLRALQDFHLKLALQSVPGVAEVASLGGMARQFQVDADPARLAAHKVDMAQVAQAVRDANLAGGGVPIEMARSEYLLRSNGYLRQPADFDDIPVPAADGAVLRLRQLASTGIGPQPRRGVADLDGAGDVTGAIVVMRHGENALATVRAVKERLAQLKKTLPAGVEIVTTYDRASLIERAVATLRDKLLEESIVVALICAVFLFRLRSALVAIVTLPLGILVALWIMRLQGVSANVMSLGGIAIAVGAMVDGAIVMIENMHRHLERAPQRPGDDIWPLVRRAATEVGPALFFSLLIITISFLPVFTLGGQELRLFAPLAYTKTYAMAAAAMLAITLTPVLMGYLIGGAPPAEAANPVNRLLKRAYRPLLEAALSWPRSTVLIALLVLATAIVPLRQIGSEFMPPLDEGDLLYMPTTMPGISAAEAADLLQRTDRIIAAMPEVARVFGKAGRADTATDPAPLSMFETTIMLKPRSEWPAGSARDNAALVDKLDKALQLPGLTNSWGYPIKTRIDMLSTGIRSALGVKISGPDLATLERHAREVETLLRAVPGTRSAFADRAGAGRYIDIDVKRDAAARHGLSVAAIQRTLQSAAGGETVGTVIDGRERYPITLRYPRGDRDGLAALEQVRLSGAGGASVPLREVASISVADGPTEIKSENARPVAYVYVDLAGSDAGGYLAAAQQALDAGLELEPGYTLSWHGQYLNFKDGQARLWNAIALTALLVAGLLYLHFRNGVKLALVLACLPFSVTGGLWLTYLLGYQLSVAVVIGLIALAGVAAEFGIVMLLYLDQALDEAPDQPRAAIMAGALLRLRPKAMTVAVILGGLLPVMLSDAAGADVMQRIAAPLIGGMITAPLFSLLVIPALYLMLRPGRPA